MAAVAAGDFWATWGDGKAELNGYQLRQPRYGQPRDGSLVLIYVTEDFSDRRRVKADPGKHAASDVYPVLKLNAARKFQTGIYDYSVLLSLFARVDAAPGERSFPLRKLSLSSQEWCGHVYHQLLPQAGPPPRLLSHSHSYFDGEADEQRLLDSPPDLVSEDELPVLLRRYPQKPDWMAPGTRRTVPFLPSLLRARLLHQPLQLTEATFERHAGPIAAVTPAGAFVVETYTVSIRGGDRGVFHIEAAAPYRLVHYRWESGEEALLSGSARLPYWQLHDNGQESYLKQLGLTAPAIRRTP